MGVTWEILEDEPRIERAKIEGGWLYRTESSRSRAGSYSATEKVFLAGVLHAWDESEPGTDHPEYARWQMRVTKARAAFKDSSIDPVMIYYANPIFVPALDPSLLSLADPKATEAIERRRLVDTLRSFISDCHAEEWKRRTIIDNLASLANLIERSARRGDV